MEFNESQKKAVRHCDGPMLLLAGPGSGKTTVITHRIKYMTEEHGVRPDNILVITFTKAAANEMIQFSTYAVPMITGEIKRFLRDDGAVKISRTLKENAMKGWRCEELLRRKLNRQPTINEISKESGIDAESLIEAFEAATPPESIYESVYDNGDKEIRLLDTITGEEIEDGVINKVMIDDILSRLTEREKEIILLRYFRGKTQSEIAKIIGVSQVQISRIEKKAIERIRGEMP